MDWGKEDRNFPLVHVLSLTYRAAVSIFLCPYSPVCEMLLAKPESLPPCLFWETSHSHFIELGVNTTFRKSNLNVAGILSDKETTEITASNKCALKGVERRGNVEEREEEQRENGQCCEVSEQEL